MTKLAPITLTGRDGTRRLTIENPLFLAPMEGVTDPCFRRLVAARGGVGVLCTEFIRISQGILPLKILRQELGTWEEPCPIGLQFMAADTQFLAETVSRAHETRAQYVDLNFGCPVKRVFNKCAGSALLDHPDRMHAIVACTVQATPLPVTAKIRAGVTDHSKLKDIIQAVIDAGATMIAMHARLRSESYAMPAHWEWLSEAKQIINDYARQVPLIANGGIDVTDDIDRAIAATGCDGVMIGRAAIANPFIFRHYSLGEPARRSDMSAFVVDYWHAMNDGRPQKGGLGRIKQLLKYAKGDLLFSDDAERERLMRATDIQCIWDYLSQWTEIPSTA